MLVIFWFSFPFIELKIVNWSLDPAVKQLFAFKRTENVSFRDWEGFGADSHIDSSQAFHWGAHNPQMVTPDLWNNILCMEFGIKVKSSKRANICWTEVCNSSYRSFVYYLKLKYYLSIYWELGKAFAKKKRGADNILFERFCPKDAMWGISKTSMQGAR